MFGYVAPDLSQLTPEARARYQACYCGLCEALQLRHGQRAKLTLSNDMAFLNLLLLSLYEPEETASGRRCVLRVFRPTRRTRAPVTDYAADMCVALSYHKCRDDWQDERSVAGRLEASALQKAYARVKDAWPATCAVLEDCLTEISRAEARDGTNVDLLANQTARLLGAVYRYRDDVWADTLETMGAALGRFVYLMDAYDDLPRDLRRKRFNPLTEMHARPGYDEVVTDALSLLLAECTDAFETLPCVQDVDILRNILYSGVWARYRRMQEKGGARRRHLAKLDGEEGGRGDE